jgi:class 3 adenylate cyclase
MAASDRLRRALLITLAVALAAPMAARAGALEVTSLDPPTSLHAAWRCAAGDDPAWAQPGFDDSGWAARALPELDGGSPCLGPRAWFRLRLKIPEALRGEPLGISAGEVDGAYEVWIDGVPIGGHGTLEPRVTNGLRVGEAFSIPRWLVEDGELVVALRVANDPEVLRAHSTRRLVPHGPLLLGRMPSVNERAAYEVDLRVRETTGASVAMSVLFVFVALYHVLVWVMRRSLTGYLWFGIFAVAAAAWLVVVTLAGTPLLPIDARTAGVAGHFIGTLVNVAFPEFFWRFLEGKPPPRRWRIYEAILLAISLVGFIPEVGLAWTVTPPILAAKLLMPLWATWEFVRAARRGSREARVLLVAMVLGAAAAPVQAWVQTRGVDVVIHPAQVVIALFIVTMAVALVAQFTRTLAEVDARARELAETNASIQRFVPTLFLRALDKASVREVKRGDSARAVMSVMFCDVRGFTTLAEKMGPEETFRFINGYLERMEPEIHKTGGFINQYLGDGIMALFPKGADAAVDAAIGMCRALEELNAERAGRGEAPLRIGIGIHTGELSIGTIGGTGQLDSGVVGDVVNTAARLEGITKMVGAIVLVSGATVAALARPEDRALRPLDAVRAKGKTEPLVLVEVLDADPPALREQKKQSQPALEAAFALYRAGRFAEAAAAFEDLRQRCPGDGAAEALAARCHAFAASPPPAWDGVLALTSK